MKARRLGIAAVILAVVGAVASFLGAPILLGALLADPPPVTLVGQLALTAGLVFLSVSVVAGAIAIVRDRALVLGCVAITIALGSALAVLSPLLIAAGLES